MRVQHLTLSPRLASLPPHERIRIARREMPGAQYFTVSKNIVFGYPSHPLPNSGGRFTLNPIYTRKGDPCNV